MLDRKKELLERIFLNESRLLELEEVRFRRGEVTGPADSKLADELAAFANSRGGVLVLGVSDRPREVVGIPLRPSRQCGGLRPSRLHATDRTNLEPHS